MQNLITFWLTFNAKYPGYLITMAPECAYLWCGSAGWPYNSYVSVINELGPYGANIIYKINAQSYNNWCSNSPAGTAEFFEDVATTWITACPSTGYLGLEKNPEIFGLGVLAANKDGDGYAAPSIVTAALQWIGETYGTYNGMFWDTLTDLSNGWIISDGIAASIPQGSFAPTVSPTTKPTMPTVAPSFRPTEVSSISLNPSESPTAIPTVVPTDEAVSHHNNKTTAFPAGSLGIALTAGSGLIAFVAVGLLVIGYRNQEQKKICGLPNFWNTCTGSKGSHALLAKDEDDKVKNINEQYWRA